jgi:hypothetical protein
VSPADKLSDQIDDLYRGPLAEFTAARNALVKAERGADASRIRKLAKPTVVAWAVNQVYWRARKIYDQLIKSGERLRKAQIAALEGKKSADLREASDAHRRAIADAVKEAERLANAAGSTPAADALMRTFEALSLAAEPPEAPGRLTKELRPAGFEALTGVTPVARVPPQPSARDLQRDREAAAAAKREAEDEKKREAAIKKAEAAVERARKKMLAAQEALKRTRNS